MRFKALFVALLAFAIMVGTGVAQTGSITGQIFDPAGAVIANAKITATSASTGFTRTVTSTSAGIYNFGALPPSVYSLSATATGFQEQIKKDVTLSVAATLPVNFTLAISGATAVIDVRDVSSASVETDSFQLSTVIDSKQINDLPLILRDPYQLVLLSPGVVSATNNDGGVRSTASATGITTLRSMEPTTTTPQFRVVWQAYPLQIQTRRRSFV